MTTCNYPCDRTSIMSVDVLALTSACHRVSFDGTDESFYAPQKIRRRLVTRLREAGYTYGEIAVAFEVSRNRARMLVRDANRDAKRRKEQLILKREAAEDIRRSDAALLRRLDLALLT